MPLIDYAIHLIEYIFEIGISKSNGFDQTPISWSDIRDWQQVIGGQLSNWECKTLMEMSKSYVDQFKISNGSNEPAPYRTIEPDKAVVSQRVGGLLRGLAKRRSIK